MSTKKIPGTEEAWDSGQLGEDVKYAKAVDGNLTCQIDESLERQMISIRLEKGLIESFKMLGAFHGIGYQPLMRDALKRFADSEMKAIVAGMVDSQKKTSSKKSASAEHSDCEERKAA